MSINACQYWEGYNGQKRPMCNGGDPCNQCKAKFIQERGWSLDRNGLWENRVKDHSMLSIDEAFSIEDPLTN